MCILLMKLMVIERFTLPLIYDFVYNHFSLDENLNNFKNYVLENDLNN